MNSKTKVPMLAISDVSVSYGSEAVIKDINLSVLSGESFGLMGLNGAGKTTLIKAILGLRDMERGDVRVSGKSNVVGESKSLLAYLPERFDPPAFLTGEEFLRFSMKLYHRPYNSEEAHAASERLALSPSVLSERVNTYSKGMRQKLGLLATILTDCALLILDEPMSGLDPMARALVKDVLNESRSQGRTIFLSSHILADMNEICDHVAVMHSGAIEFDGTPESMLLQTGQGNLERAFLSIIRNDEATINS